MELKILDKEGKEKGMKKMPEQFDEEIRPDLIRRAVLALQSHARQRYGVAPEAGKRSSPKLSRQRRAYKGSYGMGISRVPRKILTKRGRRMFWVGAFAPGMVGGRKAHPPTAEKIFWQDINKKERRKAIRSALAATVQKAAILGRGHKVPPQFPFILDNAFEDMEKTNELAKILLKLGFGEEVIRSRKKKVRPGRGKMRGRKYVKKKSFLFVVGKDCKLLRAAKNLAGADSVIVDSINTHTLAPGGAPGRLTLYTVEAIEKMEKNRLFM
ncbi:50S ribosomal protein L4 [Candidatus Woesearchaeota archaeon]|nr:50S ribosomal protein L4 [Candidatus Woesearchaeota archaeon]